jgi:hypothetical protein
MSSSARCVTQPEPIPPRLTRVYRLTRYQAAGSEIRIGRRSPEALFERLDARGATLVTAWNPGSHRMPEGWNHRMQHRLQQHLRRFATLDAEGSLHGWREAMLLVFGDPRPVVRLATRFRQRAVVMLRRGQKARLWLL